MNESITLKYMKKIEITIIVPIFNRAEYLPGLFKCLRKQIFREYECILVDDGSWDESGELCDKFCEMDERFRVLHIDNAGVSHARNLGLSEAKGEYVVFVDSDDKIPDNYLTCLYKKITENKASIFICSIEKIWTSGKYQNIEMLEDGVYYIDELLSEFAMRQKNTGIYGFCAGKIISSELVKNIRFDEKLNLAEDFEFYLKVYEKASKIGFTRETTYYYFQESEDSLSFIADNEIDYYSQLRINLRYKHFLENKGVYTGDNKRILLQLISNYIFYTLYYCKLEEFEDLFEELYRICECEQIELTGKNRFEKWIFSLFRNKHRQLVRTSFRSYHFIRKLKGIMNSCGRMKSD